MAGTTAFVADGFSGLVIVDVTNPALPVLVDTFDTPDYAAKLSIGGSLAYVADGFSGLRIIETGLVSVVVEAGPDQGPIDEGSSVSLAPATFIGDGTTPPHTATIDWGDGTPLASGTVDQALDTVSGSHVYDDDTGGPFTVTVTVTDASGVSDQDTLVVTVVNVTREQIVTRMVEFEPGPFLASDPEYMASRGGAQPDPSVMHGLPEWLEKTTIGIPMIDEFKKELAARGMR